MAAKGKSPVSVATKKAVFALRLQGLSNAQIGERLNLHPVTVCRIFTSVKKLEAAGVVSHEPKEPPSDTEVLRNWRDRLTRKSIKALDRGLDDETDNYKAAGIANYVLRGLGEFENESINVHMNQLINSVPEVGSGVSVTHASSARILSIEE